MINKSYNSQQTAVWTALISVLCQIRWDILLMEAGRQGCQVMSVVPQVNTNVCTQIS